MQRAIFNVATILCLLISLLAAWLWVRSERCNGQGEYLLDWTSPGVAFRLDPDTWTSRLCVFRREFRRADGSPAPTGEYLIAGETLGEVWGAPLPYGAPDWVQKLGMGCGS